MVPFKAPPTSSKDTAVGVVINPSFYKVLASMFSAEASVVAAVDCYKKHTDDTPHDSCEGGIALEQFIGSQLIRFCMFTSDGKLGLKIELPHDEPWSATHRKVKGKTVSRGVEVTVTFAEDAKEFFSKFALLVPIDKKELAKPKHEMMKGPAFVFAEALIHAGELVTAAAAWLKDNNNDSIINNNKPPSVSTANPRAVDAPAANAPNHITETASSAPTREFKTVDVGVQATFDNVVTPRNALVPCAGFRSPVLSPMEVDEAWDELKSPPRWFG